MSAVVISDHIPDIDLITIFAERQTSLFSRIFPSPLDQIFLLSYLNYCTIWGISPEGLPIVCDDLVNILITESH